MKSMEQRTERLLRAIGGVGGDLIDTAQNKQFSPALWRRLLPGAACLALLAGLTFLVLPVLRGTPQAEKTTEVSQPASMPEEQPVSLPEEQPAPQSEACWLDQAISQKRRLVLDDTIYYAEAVFETANAVPGEWVGTVEGANAYAAGKTWKADHHGRKLPLELLVEQKHGYLYCLTYYAWDGPAYTMEQAQELEDLTVFALGVTFGDPAELTGEQLQTIFLETLALERQAGRRTVDLDRYLWYDEKKQAFVIPVGDVADQLNRFLAGWNWPELEEHTALVLESLDLPEREQEQFAAAVFDGDVLILTTDKRIYTIRFAQSGCRYEQVRSREPF